jgi:hypothetical protein
MRISRVLLGWQGLWVAAAILAAGCMRADAATGDPPELKDVQKMAVWRMSHPDVETADDACGIKDAQAYEAVRLDYEVDSEEKDAAATAKVKALDQKVLTLLTQRRWVAVKMAKAGGGIPNLRRCYRKSGVIAQIYQTTGRCTMNTPCTAYDGFTVVFYMPKNG